MTTRRNYNTGAKWEPIVGYSRAVRIADTIEVSGTCAVDPEGNAFAKGDPYLQASRCLEIIRTAIEHLDGKLEDVIRTRIYVTNMDHWSEIGKAHGEVFGHIRPVTTIVEVSSLISADYLVEIEATAIVSH